MSYGNPNRHTDCEKLSPYKALTEDCSHLGSEVDKLRAQNAELLAGLRPLIGYAAIGLSYTAMGDESAIRKARDLIARIDAKKGDA